MVQELENKRTSNREKMPAVAEVIDAHIAAFGDDFTLLRCIDYTSNFRSSRKGQVPYEFPEGISDSEIVENANHRIEQP